MTLKEQIQKDLIESLKNRNEAKVSLLRMLSSSIHNKEIAKGKDYILKDEETLEVISSEVKQRKEAAFQFEKGERKDLADKEKKEAAMLLEYLPKQMEEKEIREIAEEAIKNTKAESLKDMGKVMAQIMPKVKGKADNSLVSKIVKEILSK